METTLRKIQGQKLNRTGWLQLLNHLGKTQADDEPVAIATILTVNGLGYAAACLNEVEGFDKEIKRFNLECAKDVRHLMTPACQNVLDIAESDFNGTKPMTSVEFKKILGDAEDEAWKVGFVGERFADHAAIHAASVVSNPGKVTEKLLHAAADSVYCSYPTNNKSEKAMNDIQQRQVDRLKALCAGKEIATDGLEWKVPETLYKVYNADEAMTFFGKPDADGWRLPTVDECMTRMHRFIDNKARKQEPFGCFWTSSTSKTSTNRATYVNFRKGEASCDFTFCDYRIRLVRKLK